jgi:hypothetical protein
LVKDVLSSLCDSYNFCLVGCQREYYHKGDIKATAADGSEVFIEVKDDSRIADTGRVLCEEKVFFNNGHEQEGFMHSDYEIFCIVSQPERKMYFIDFDVLKNIYKKGEFKLLHHPEQYSECYLLELCHVKKYGGLIKVLSY